MVMRTADGLSLVTPMTTGAADHRPPPLEERGPRPRDPLARRPEGKPKFTGTSSTSRTSLAPRRNHSTAIAALCACHAPSATASEFCAEPRRSDEYARAPPASRAAATMWGDQRLAAACLAAFTECDERLACVQNDPLFAPACPEGQVHAFASNACFAVCDAPTPAPPAPAPPWHGGSVCVVD
jgi:hypothetical protein